MASSTKLSFHLFFVFSLFVHGTMGDVICEELPRNLCSFAVSSLGKRCVLENECKTSEIESGRLFGYVETDQCTNVCGVDRQSGMSSDQLVSQQFIASLCSPACYHNCPNIADLYSNLAAGEGKSLQAMCRGVALPPVPAQRGALDTMLAPASSPTYL